ncbi:MAG: outer membrane beta-barrel protein [Paludibacteraceae bacterium]|nr:outer membrane beta-barrel protein [Paludibacteraceae bacterium]
MKRKLFLFSMVLAAAMLSAQEQWFGMQFGFAEHILRENTVSNTKKLSDKTVGNGTKIGFVYDVTLVKGFGLNLAFNYNFAAASGKWEVENPLFVANKRRTSVAMHILEIPIEWQYKFNIATDTWLIAYTGPTMQFNVAYNTTITHRNDATNQVTEEKINHFTVDNDGDNVRDYSRFNIQWGVGAGFQYKNYYIRGGYNFGIYNHYRDNFHNTGSYTTRGRYDEWNIRLGIYFLNF